MADLLEAPDEDAYGDGYSEDGQWPPRECVLCFAETRLRCGVCRYAVCHNCPECPNGCDGSPAPAPGFEGPTDNLAIEETALGGFEFRKCEPDA